MIEKLKETEDCIKISLSAFDLINIRSTAKNLGFKTPEEYCQFVLKNAKVSIEVPSVVT